MDTVVVIPAQAFAKAGMTSHFSKKSSLKQTDADQGRFRKK
jgi:hypothetical protein